MILNIGGKMSVLVSSPKSLTHHHVVSSQLCSGVRMFSEVFCTLYSTLIVSHIATWKTASNRWSLTEHHLPSCLVLTAERREEEGRRNSPTRLINVNTSSEAHHSTNCGKQVYFYIKRWWINRVFFTIKGAIQCKFHFYSPSIRSHA